MQVVALAHGLGRRYSCLGVTYIRNTLSRERMMSRAFVKEDADEPEPRYVLPKRDHPSYDDAAAWALALAVSCSLFAVRCSLFAVRCSLLAEK